MTHVSTVSRLQSIFFGSCASPGTARKATRAHTYAHLLALVPITIDVCCREYPPSVGSVVSRWKAGRPQLSSSRVAGWYSSRREIRGQSAQGCAVLHFVAPATIDSRGAATTWPLSAAVDVVCRTIVPCGRRSTASAGSQQTPRRLFVWQILASY